jgi:hypothetical protein
MRFVALYAVLALAAAIGVSAQVVSDPVVTNNGCFCQAPGCTIPGIPDVEENRSCNVTDECFLGSVGSISNRSAVVLGRDVCLEPVRESKGAESRSLKAASA